MGTQTSFVWNDGDRTIHFGSGAAAGAVDAFGGPGFLLLTTPRAEQALPQLVAAAAAVIHVPAGQVDALARDVLAQTDGTERRIAALGGGRLADVAKAVAAAHGDGARALAVPTTISGAELSGNHRHAAGVDERTPRVRASVVVYDPVLVTSQPPEQLAASASNALAHAIEAPCTTARNPVATLAANEAARLIVGAFDTDRPDLDTLALGALLAGYALDSCGIGLHHVLAQTLVRSQVTGHGPANAIMLPHTIGALERRSPDAHAGLAAALGEPPADAAARITARTGTTRLRDTGARRAEIDTWAEIAGARPELARTPPRADLAELRALYDAAW